MFRRNMKDKKASIMNFLFKKLVSEVRLSDSSIFRRILLYSNLLLQKCRITNKPQNSVGLFIPAHTAVG